VRTSITIQALDPATGALRDVYIDQGTIERIRTGPLQRFHILVGGLVSRVLERPEEVWKGIRDDGSGYAYVGNPGESRSEHGELRPVPPNLTFVAYLTEDWYLYEWRWDRLKSRNKRYDKQIWPIAI